MKSNLEITHTLKQTFKLNSSMKRQLEILSMNNNTIIEQLSSIASTNPFFEYSPNEEIQDYLINNLSNGPNLKDELYFQLHTCKDSYDPIIANYIIESLDSHGFFTISYQQACHDLQTSEENIVKHIQLIQSFEPIGVAAKNSIDSICIQLHKKGIDLAIQLLRDYENELLTNDLKSISRKMNLSIDKIHDLLSQIRKCNPFPCSDYSIDSAQWIIPDIEITINQNDVSINTKNIGHYNLVDPLEPVNPSLKDYLNQAKFTIDSLNKRNKTLLIISNEIIKYQQGFFLYSDELKPCTLQEIANKTGFSESTISRTAANKYYLFQNKIYPLKNLFISKTKKGSSKDSIQKAIKYLIDHENPDHPYLDEDLVKELFDLELFVARRTVTKYRQQLNIPNAKKRKKIYALKSLT